MRERVCVCGERGEGRKREREEWETDYIFVRLD